MRRPWWEGCLRHSHWQRWVAAFLFILLLILQVGGLLELGEVDGETVTTLCLDPSDPRLAPRLEEDFPREVVALVEEEIQSRLLPLLHLLLPSSHQLNRRQAHPHLLRLGDMVRELQVRLLCKSYIGLISKQPVIQKNTVQKS